MATVVNLFPKRQGLPSVTRILVTAARAAGRIAVAAASGERVTVPVEVKAARLATCDACPHQVAGRCGICGCGLGGLVLDKTMWATERCPDQPPRWTECTN